MTSYDKLLAMFWVCVTTAVICIASLTYAFNVNTFKAGVSAGLVQDEKGYWVKPK